MTSYCQIVTDLVTGWRVRFDNYSTDVLETAFSIVSFPQVYIQLNPPIVALKRIFKQKGGPLVRKTVLDYK